MNITKTSKEVFGIFDCSTRSGDAPLWIVNQATVDAVRNSSGYSRTYYQHHALQGEGHILSFLYLPASALTNNSMVICAAVGHGELLALSDPVYLTVLYIPLGKQNWLFIEKLSCF